VTTILYVDDDETSVRMFQKTFAGDYRVLTAHGADDAAAIMNSEPVDVLLTDQMMPKGTGGTGAFLIDSLRPKFKNLKAAIITAYADFKGVLEDATSIPVLLKPYEKSQVIEIVNRLMNPSPVTT
jgi:DNA-binding NtrC family response regulator